MSVTTTATGFATTTTIFLAIESNAVGGAAATSHKTAYETAVDIALAHDFQLLLKISQQNKKKQIFCFATDTATLPSDEVQLMEENILFWKKKVLSCG